MATGKVYLIGAGPGDAGLLTIKGLEVLQQADVVVYDALVSDSIKVLIPPQAESIYVGKRASHHSMDQENINQVLLQQALKGKTVARLKGGDPFLFGRGGEELELLVNHHIPFEVVPGITSALAVAAYNGIPVTHRDYCSSLHIITGHKRAGQLYNMDFEALVRTKGTLVFLMGVSALPDICTGLLQAGMNPNTPAAVLQQGTTAGQKRIVATVGSLHQAVLEQGVQTPAIIVVGEVCALSEQFAWYESLPLSGAKVLVARPKELSSALSKRLRELGAEVLELPTIQTVPVDTETLLPVLQSIEQYQWIALTSPNGVQVLFDHLKQVPCDLRRLATVKFAVVGNGTRQALQEKGILADLMPTVFDGIHLAQELVQQGVQDQKILIPRAAQGNPELVELLQAHGAMVTDLATYETTPCAIPHLETQLESVDYLLFTSSSTVTAFVNANPNLQFDQMQALCIGKKTHATAKQHGFITTMSEQATIDSLIALLCTLHQK